MGESVNAWLRGPDGTETCKFASLDGDMNRGHLDLRYRQAIPSWDCADLNAALSAKDLIKEELCAFMCWTAKEFMRAVRLHNLATIHKMARSATCRAKPISCATHSIVMPSSTKETIVSKTSLTISRSSPVAQALRSTSCRRGGWMSPATSPASWKTSSPIALGPGSLRLAADRRILGACRMRKACRSSSRRTSTACRNRTPRHDGETQLSWQMSATVYPCSAAVSQPAARSMASVLRDFIGNTTL